MPTALSRKHLNESTKLGKYENLITCEIYTSIDVAMRAYLQGMVSDLTSHLVYSRATDPLQSAVHANLQMLLARVNRI